MSKFMKGDKVIIKSTIGTTNEVLEVTYVFDVCVAMFTTEEAVILSDEKGYWAKDLELWNAKKDLNGEYGMKKELKRNENAPFVTVKIPKLEIKVGAVYKSCWGRCY